MKSPMPPADAERLRNYERTSQDALASGYRDFFAHVTALAIAPLLDAAQVAHGTRLLDVASGPGFVAAAAQQRGSRPAGVDLSPRMVEVAQALYPGIGFKEADVEHLPFADATFDAVVCNFGIGHFPNPELAVAECLRVLRPGGHIAFAWWDDPIRHRLQAVFREATAEVGAAPPDDLPQGHSSLRFCDGAEFLRLLRGAELADTAVEPHAATYLVSDVETWWHGGLTSLVLTGAAIRNQDEATRSAIHAAFARRALPYATDGGFRIPIAFNIGSGRKSK
jgi:SAM-dependent methyltransferase